MKAKKGFNLRNVCGEQIIVAEGKENIDFSNIISMNESSAYLWKNVQQLPEFNCEKLAELLTEQYEIDFETALEDAKTLSQQWLEAGIIEEEFVAIKSEEIRLRDEPNRPSTTFPSVRFRGLVAIPHRS